MPNAQNAILVLIVVIVQMLATTLQQLGSRERLNGFRRKPQRLVPLSVGSFLESNPFLERRWKLPILYYIDSTHDAKTRNSIKKSISYWQSVTCARFEEVTNRTQVMTSPSPTNYVIFTANRVIGRQCMTNVFSREHAGLAADEDDADIYQRVSGCLTLTATRQTDVRMGSIFYFYLNEQVPPFKDDFLEAINVNQPTATEAEVSDTTEVIDSVKTTSLYQLPGLSFHQIEAMNSVYCEGCRRDDAEHLIDCPTKRCQPSTLSAYANDGCKDTPPSIDPDCNRTRTVTGKEECETSPSLAFGMPQGDRPRAFCPWHLEGRDGCRILITYTGRMAVERPCGRNIRKDSSQHKTDGNQRDGLKPNSSRQTRDTKAKSCHSQTRIGVNGTLLSLRRSATVIFRTRYAPDDETNANSSGSSISSSSSSRSNSGGGRGGPSHQAQTNTRKAEQFHLQFTVCFRLVCDEFIGSSLSPLDKQHPDSTRTSSPNQRQPHGTTRRLLARRTSRGPARILMLGQPWTTTPFIDIRLLHLERQTLHLRRDMMVAENTTQPEEDTGFPVREVVIGGLFFLSLVISIAVGVTIIRSSPLSDRRQLPRDRNHQQQP